MCVLSAVCSVRVIGESDIMQEFLSESDEVMQKNIRVCVFLWSSACGSQQFVSPSNELEL